MEIIAQRTPVTCHKWSSHFFELMSSDSSAHFLNHQTTASLIHNSLDDVIQNTVYTLNY